MTIDQKTMDEPGPWTTWGDGGISKAEFEDYLARKQARQVNAPVVGQSAPDFEVEELDTYGKQTGQLFRLSSVYGKPVALVFGSYT